MMCEIICDRIRQLISFFWSSVMCRLSRGRCRMSDWDFRLPYNQETEVSDCQITGLLGDFSYWMLLEMNIYLFSCMKYVIVAFIKIFESIKKTSCVQYEVSRSVDLHRTEVYMRLRRNVMKVDALRDILEDMMYFIDLWVHQFRLEWNPLQICTTCRAEIDVSCTFIPQKNQIWLKSCLKWNFYARKKKIQVRGAFQEISDNSLRIFSNFVFLFSAITHQRLKRRG